MSEPRTIDDRVSVVSRFNEETRLQEDVVVYDAPRAKKLKEIKVFSRDPASHDTSAYHFRAGFVAGLQEKA